MKRVHRIAQHEFQKDQFVGFAVQISGRVHVAQLLRKLSHRGTVRVKNQNVRVQDHGPDLAERQHDHVLARLNGRYGSSNGRHTLLLSLLPTCQIECKEQIAGKDGCRLEQFCGAERHGFHCAIVRDARHFKGGTRSIGFDNRTCGDSASVVWTVVWIVVAAVFGRCSNTSRARASNTSMMS